jgi:hypothetical protein
VDTGRARFAALDQGVGGQGEADGPVVVLPARMVEAILAGLVSTRRTRASSSRSASSSLAIPAGLCCTAAFRHHVTGQHRLGHGILLEN